MGSMETVQDERDASESLKLQTPQLCGHCNGGRARQQNSSGSLQHSYMVFMAISDEGTKQCFSVPDWVGHILHQILDDSHNTNGAIIADLFTLAQNYCNSRCLDDTDGHECILGLSQCQCFLCIQSV